MIAGVPIHALLPIMPILAEIRPGGMFVKLSSHRKFLPDFAPTVASLGLLAATLGALANQRGRQDR